MRTRLYVYAALALSAAVPSAALAAVTVNTTTIQAPAGGAVAGSVVPVLCQAEGNSGMLGSTAINRIDVTVSGGTVAPPSLTGAVTQTCSSGSGTCSWLSGTVQWTTPATPGPVTATCTVTYTTTGFGTTTGTAASSATTTTIAGAPVTAAPAVGAISGAPEALVGTSAQFSVGASDVNQPPLPITYAWSVTGGTVTASATDPSKATWQAPAASGSYVLTVTVSNGVLSTSSTKTVTAALAQFQAALSLGLRAPRRLCPAQDGLGGVYAVDGRQGTLGTVSLLNVRGEVRGVATLPEPAIAVAQGAGALWITGAAGSLMKVDSASGRYQGSLSLAGGPLLRAFGVAYESTRTTLWVAEMDANRVRILRPDGTAVKTLSTAGTVPLGTPIDVAVDSAGGRAWVLDAEKNSAGAFLHAYDLDGNYLGSYLANGEISRGGGVAVGPNGRVYVTDAFQGVVQVLDRTGVAVGTIGSFGEAVGQLIAPAGLAVMVNGDVAVATPTNSSVVRYGTGAALPATCMVAGQLDSDCDGLPDAWELAHGLDPHNPADALLAFAGTGFLNYEVYAYQAAYGTDPWAPPTVVASAPVQTPPGLVKLSATPSGPPTYAVACAWRQVSGPAVALTGAGTIAPTFIARVPAVYTFEVAPTTSLAAGAAARVSVTVTNAAPIADPGRIVVAAPGSAVRLDGTFSSDANGDALTYAWDQSLGAPVTGTVPGPTLSVNPRGPGLYKFMLTASDGRGKSSSAEVPVLVAAPPVSTAVATASPAAPQVGSTVSLDGSASLFADASPAFLWAQLDGPATVTLAGASGPLATFVPAAAGRYAFGLTVVGSDGQRSPPARVDVYVADAGRALPAIQSASTAASVVAVNTAVALDAAGTGTGYAWKQVAGPAAGLTDANAATATAVPFSPGLYAFEVAATDGAAVSPPARVSFEARVNGKPIPVARVSVPGLAPAVGQLVFLDGRGSTGAARYRWTQVAGPWVILQGQSAVTTFRPHDPGTYAFELEVDDGSVRSAPARVEIVVSEQGVY